MVILCPCFKPLLRDERERDFRAAFDELLRHHGADVEIISGGGELDQPKIQVTMNGCWHGDCQIRQFSQFTL